MPTYNLLAAVEHDAETLRVRREATRAAALAADRATDLVERALTAARELGDPTIAQLEEALITAGETAVTAWAAWEAAVRDHRGTLGRRQSLRRRAAQGQLPTEAELQAFEAERTRTEAWRVTARADAHIRRRTVWDRVIIGGIPLDLD